MPRTAFWWACVLAAPPIAWVVASNGYGIVVSEPVRDIAYLMLWSAGEEVLFRGLIQPKLASTAWIANDRAGAQRGRIAGITLSNLITSLLFALAHLWQRTPLVALGVLPISLVLGASFERSGRLWVPVALHCSFNLWLYAVSWLQRAPN